MRRGLFVAGACGLWLVACGFWATTAAQQPPRADSPASQRPAQGAAQSYDPAVVQAGGVLFAAQCGFCHGRDAMGGETGPDLTRSALVAEDVRGDKISVVVKNGRLDKKMPAFSFSDGEMLSLVAFIHDAAAKAASLEGGRRAVDVSDLQTGNAASGKAYFEGAGGCTKCHSATGDLAGIGSRLQGLVLIEEMLYPTGRGGRMGKPPTPASVTITTQDGQVIRGKLAYRDEFNIAITETVGGRPGSDPGAYRSFSTDRVKVVIDDPRDAHYQLLGKYTNADFHNLFAYIQSLK